MALSVNKQKEKDWNILIKQEGKRFGWKFKSFFSYKSAKDFFYDVTFYTSGSVNAISGSLSFKPLIIDETFWEIVNLLDNKRMPLSLRGNGAFVVNSINVFDYKLTVIPETLKVEIDSLFHKLNLKVEELQSTIVDIDTFISFIEQNPSKRSEWFDVDMLIVAFIVKQNYEKALSLLDNAKKNRGMCSWSFGDKDFYDLAIEYCQKHQ